MNSYSSFKAQLTHYLTCLSDRGSENQLCAGHRAQGTKRQGSRLCPQRHLLLQLPRDCPLYSAGLTLAGALLDALGVALSVAALRGCI